MAYITLNQFKAYYNINSTDYDNYLNNVINLFADAIDEFVGFRFVIEAGNKTLKGENIYGIVNVPVNIWQKNNLNVTRATYGGSSQVLTLNTDYMLQDIPGNEDATDMIRLLCSPLYANEYLAISGNKGWSNGLPSRLQTAYNNALFTAYKYNIAQVSSLDPDNLSTGLIKSVKDQTTNVTYAGIDEFSQYAFELANGNLMAVPSIGSMLQAYKKYSDTTIQVAS